MAWERDNAAEEFETMLRRHLMRSAGRSASCEGFDAERASAYIENALSGAVRLGYEDHLAGCASCRRAVIELRRLMPEIEIAGASVRRPNRLAEWWEGVRQGVTAVPWRWGTAAAAGAFAVLLGVVLIPFYRQASAPAEPVALMATPAPLSAASDVSAEGSTVPGQPQPVIGNESAGPVPSSQTTRIGGSGAAQPARARGTASASVAPVIQMTGPVASTAVAVDGHGSISGRVSNPAGEAVGEAQVALVDAATALPRAVTKTGADGQFRFVDVPGGNYSLTVQASGFQPQLIANVRPEAGREVAVRLDAGADGRSTAVAMTAPGGAPAPAPAASDAAEPKHEAEKATGEAVAENRTEARSAARRDSRNQPPPDAGASAFVPRPKPKTAKRQSAPSAAEDDETVRAMTRKVRDKTFRFENGRWIDSEFKPEYLPPRIRLDRNGADFERVLAEHPDLKLFFDLGRVIVVWKGKVYEVL